MNFLFLLFGNLSLKVIEWIFSHLQVRFVMTHKSCFGNFYEKVSETLIGDKIICVICFSISKNG